ncbi:MAG: 2-isopropylmalate synthase [Eubacteriales bacterium]|nr:2-isopropylmalate synthase [Eubacteriales bacterium]
MVEYGKNSNLLEISAFQYELQNPKEPNLYRGIYDYDQIPKTAFNYRLTPMNPPDQIWITDTTFRDGQQAQSPFSVEHIANLYALLHKLGGPKGLIRQCEFFVYTEKDRASIRRCQEMGFEFPEITTWIRANDSDFDLVKEMGIRETGILVSCSDYHIYEKMHMDRKQALDKYLGVVKRVLDRGIVPRCHFEDITRADFYGFVLPFANELMKLSAESGVPIKIRACDTLGYGVSYPGAALPRSVPGIIYGLHHYSRVPSEQLEWHGHNDFYKVVTNAATAWLYGCSSVNCSMLGIGERTGNCPLEAMAIEYASLRGTTDGMDLSVITEIAQYFENNFGYDIPPNTPFVGRNFNSTRAGIHADGMLKNEEIYNIFNTAKILNRPATVSVDEHSGLAGIAFWLNSYYGLKGDHAVLKTDPIVAQMKAEVDKLYADGRNTVMSDYELDFILSQIDPERHVMMAVLRKKDHAKE